MDLKLILDTKSLKKFTELSCSLMECEFKIEQIKLHIEFVQEAMVKISLENKNLPPIFENFDDILKLNLKSLKELSDKKDDLENKIKEAQEEAKNREGQETKFDKNIRMISSLVLYYNKNIEYINKKITEGNSKVKELNKKLDSNNPKDKDKFQKEVTKLTNIVLKREEAKNILTKLENIAQNDPDWLKMKYSILKNEGYITDQEKEDN